MSDFNPGPGWVAVEPADMVAPESGVEEVLHLIPGKQVQRFVREAPVPPLPTAPYTVIRVTWKPLDAMRTYVFVLLDGFWRNKHGEVLDPAGVDSFEVLSEPRATTAKAVLEYIRDTIGDDYFGTVISDHFGADA